MNVKEKYPALWAFFHAAFQANSGGWASEKDFTEFTAEQMQQADTELRATMINPSLLGSLADEGYCLWGQTHQDREEGGDDDQHKLLAFELLDTRY